MLTFKKQPPADPLGVSVRIRAVTDQTDDPKLYADSILVPEGKAARESC